MPTPRQPLVLRLVQAVQSLAPLRQAGQLARQAMIRTALYPVWLSRRADQGHLEDGADADSSGSPELDTERLNAAAERYFAEYRDREFILDKPYSDRRNFAKHLFDMGVLFHSLRLEPGDVVVEIGAGTCWLSHFLNRFGLKTVAVDVSPTALELGRELFRRDPRTDWSLEPEFRPYDGHTLPLADGSCDRIVINDAFHHIPNPDRILAEMARILKAHGIVAMCEPGPHHSETVASRRETETGVLERDIVVGELARAARRAGFGRVQLVPLNLSEAIEIPADELDHFLRGRGFIRYWTELSNGLAASHYLVLYKSAHAADTRRPDRLKARIQVARWPEAGRVARVGERVRLTVSVTNRGNTRWLAGEGQGWTRLGIHLEGGDDIEDFDWLRVELPADVEPRETVELAIELPALERPGAYELTLDLVVEGKAWFKEYGSELTRLTLRVR